MEDDSGWGGVGGVCHVYCIRFHPTLPLSPSSSLSLSLALPLSLPLSTLSIFCLLELSPSGSHQRDEAILHGALSLSLSLSLALTYPSVLPSYPVSLRLSPSQGRDDHKTSFITIL